MKRPIEAAALACLLALAASAARAQELDPGDQPPPPPSDQPAPPPPTAEPPPVGAAPPAPVEAEPEEAQWARSQTSRVGVEVDLWSAQDTIFGTDVSLFGLPIVPVAQLRLVESVYLVVEVPLAYGKFSTDSDSRGTFTIGNPTLGAYYGTVIEKQFAIFVGGTVSVPTFFDPGDEGNEDRLVAVATSANTRAYADFHRFFPEALPIRVFGGAEIKIIPNLYYTGDLVPVFYVPLDREAGQEDDVEFFMEQGNEIEYRADMGLGGGFRFQEVFTWTENDKIQTAAELYGVYEPPEPGFYARAGFFLALDEQAGFGFDEGKLASFRFALGGKW